MSGRMDLEARLRALREGKRLPARPPSPPPPPVPTAASFSWPDVPSSPVKHEISVRKPVPVAANGDYQPVRRASGRFSAAPPVTIMRRSSSDDSAPCASFPVSVEPLKARESVPEQEEVLRLTAAQLLGPEYEEAVKVAQYAIDNERRQLPHTAIDAYIQAGQMLIEIGRRQAAPHLQEIVKAKALALLQRAEGLSEWTSEVLAKDSSQQALATAYEQSQQNRSRSLTEKQELVTKMQQDNRHMKEKLNQLALLTKIRGRMMKVVKRRRARKAEEAKVREENQAAQGSTSTQSGFNDVTGEMDDYEDEEEGEQEGLNDVIGFEEEEDNKTYQHFRATKAPATRGSPRETQKVGLINELHERIGLPQIDHLRKFEPLTSDPTADNRQEELQSELEAAKQEADKLRAAVQDMEKCLRLAAQHSKQRSMKLEKQKAQEFAEVQSELDRVRGELENERRRSASFQSGPSSWRSDRSSVASDPGTDEYEDTGVMQHLRSSLHKVFRGRDELSGTGSHRASVQRTSYSHNSPRHTPKASEKGKQQTYEVDEEDMKEEEDDGGVWLYSRVKLLGEGSFGRVFLMREKKSGGRLVCVKQIHRVHRPKMFFTPPDDTKGFRGEAELMKKLRHPNLIRLLSSFIGPSPLRQEHLEYCSGGDLQSYLKGQKAIGLSEEKIWYWFIQLALGLHHMHQQRVLHRDLKTANIFLSDAGYLVLGDLGIARTLSKGDMATTVIGTPLYMAPEVLDGKEYSFSSDVWALGCVLYELCTGKPPFTASNTPQLLNKICHGDYAPIQKGDYIQSSRIPTLVASMLRTRPDLRPSVDQLLRDSMARLHIRRYCVDRLQSTNMTEEERRALVQQVAALGVDPNITTQQEAIQVESYSRHKIQSDRDQEQQEQKLMVQREQERQDQIRFALQRLQQLRLDFPAAGPSKGQSNNSEVPPPPPLKLQDEGWKVPVHDEQWREPVRAVNDCAYRLHPLGRSNSVPKYVVFTGIPRPGVPLTSMAKTFTARRPVCRDVRSLKQREIAKATERYKRRLGAMNTSQHRKSDRIGAPEAPARTSEELTWDMDDGRTVSDEQRDYQNVAI